MTGVLARLHERVDRFAEQLVCDGAGLGELVDGEAVDERGYDERQVFGEYARLKAGGGDALFEDALLDQMRDRRSAPRRWPRSRDAPPPAGWRRPRRTCRAPSGARGQGGFRARPSHAPL